MRSQNWHFKFVGSMIDINRDIVDNAIYKIALKWLK